MWLSELPQLYRLERRNRMSICADFSGGFFQVVSVATGMTGSDEPSWRSGTRSASGRAFDHAINVRIDITGNPDAGLIVQGAGGGVDQGVLSFGM